MTGERPLGIVCGRGLLPAEAAEIARARGRQVFLVGLAGSAGPEIEAFDHVWVKLGELGKMLKALQSRGVEDCAMLGAVARPEFSDIRLDWGAISRAGEIAKLFRRGDDGLLKGVAGILEREGLRIVGVADFAPELLAPLGRIAGPSPDDGALADIAFGARLLEALSPFDVGQGAVVARGRVVAVEAAEGTDAMLARVAEMRAGGRLRFKGRAGMFVKAAKRGQDHRFDLPAVGVRTIEAAAGAGLVGVAIAAGQALIVEREKFVAAADAAGLAIVGF
ncbi:MAG: LpxI family protein [Roseiarcus sp.]